MVVCHTVPTAKTNDKSKNCHRCRLSIFPTAVDGAGLFGYAVSLAGIFVKQKPGIFGRLTIGCSIRLTIELLFLFAKSTHRKSAIRVLRQGYQQGRERRGRQRIYIGAIVAALTAIRRIGGCLFLGELDHQAKSASNAGP
jgi:hypothetical protein